MIPVTTFAGQRRSPVFGLGTSRPARPRGALIAGGADVVVLSTTSATMRVDAAAAERRPHAQDLRKLDWSTHRRAGAGARRAADPSRRRTGRSSSRASAGVEIIGDIELFCRERAQSRRQCPLVAITGTNGKSTTTALIAHLLAAPAATRRSAAISACRCWRWSRSRRGRVYVLEVLVLPDRSRALAGPDGRHSAQRLAGPSRPPRHAWRTTPRSRRWCRRVEPGGTAVIGVDDRYTRDAADRIERAGKTSCASRCRRRCATAIYAEGSAHLARHRRQGACRWRSSPASARLRGAHNAQNAACALAACLRARPRLPDDADRGLRASPASPTACSRSAAAAACSSSTIQRPPTPTPPPRRWRAFPEFSGSPAAGRRPAASTASPNFFRASARPI